jgi:pimeloyl-ACP methyl ester carboxylesterase
VFGLVVVGFLIVRRPERAGEWIKGIFQMVADIAGFWAPRSVPLAGASYRSILMEGVDEAIKHAGPHPVALVGHSQGSVICAWYMATRQSPQSRITLYTCGSPLWSLYAAFFPTHFGRDFFDNVARNSAGGHWYNYWRLTDPIATALPSAHDRDVTERHDAPLRGHSEYWRESKLRVDINADLHGADLAAQP